MCSVVMGGGGAERSTPSQQDSVVPASLSAQDKKFNVLEVGACTLDTVSVWRCALSNEGSAYRLDASTREGPSICVGRRIGRVRQWRGANLPFLQAD